MDDSPQSSGPPSVLDSLRTVEFRLGLKGYNVDEVDEYLEKAAVEATALKEQLRAANERLAQATERIAALEGGAPKAVSPAAPPALEPREEPAAIAPAREVEPVAAPDLPQPARSDDSLAQTLVMAQRFVEQAKRESESEAASLVARAEDRAHSIVAQAEDHARQLAMDAEARLREEVQRLESARGQLATDVESLSRYLDSERGRLRGSLDEIGKWLDDKLQPAATLASLRARPAGSGERPEIASGGRLPAQTPPPSVRPPTDGPGAGAGSGALDLGPGSGPSGS